MESKHRNFKMITFEWRRMNMKPECGSQLQLYPLEYIFLHSYSERESKKENKEELKDGLDKEIKFCHISLDSRPHLVYFELMKNYPAWIYYF